MIFTEFQKEIVLVDSEKRPGFMIVTLISQSNQLKVKSVNCIQNQKKKMFVCLFVLNMSMIHSRE